MTYEEAKILISEAKKLGFKGLPWQRTLIERLDNMKPKYLRPEDAIKVVEIYRFATGGGTHERRQIIDSKGHSF